MTETKKVIVMRNGMGRLVGWYRGRPDWRWTPATSSARRYASAAAAEEDRAMLAASTNAPNTVHVEDEPKPW